MAITMAEMQSIKILADEIRQAYRSNPAGAHTAIQTCLDERLAGLSADEKEATLTGLAAMFDSSDPGTPEPEVAGDDVCHDEAVLTRLFSLLLGREISTEDLSSRELMERLSAALNTIFATLNRLILNINTTLLPGNNGDQTIRQVIGSRMEGDEEQITLEAYLGRIDKAFLVSHQAFRQAAHTLVRRILGEIDPEKIATNASQGLKFGPLKKAEYFDIYETKFLTVNKWFESGRFMEDLLREFEKNCRLDPE